MEKQYLTSEEVLEKARAMNLELTDRKLKYYATVGVVPKPVKGLKGMPDKRVAYYPGTVTKRLAKIKELQESGFTLAQIKKYFENEIEPALKHFLKEENISLGSIVKILSNDAVRAAAEDFRIKIKAGTGEQTFLKAAEEYYVSLLSQVASVSSAKKYVAEILRSKGSSQREQLLDPLRKLKTKYDDACFSSVSSELMEICRKLEGGTCDEQTILRQLKQQAAKVHDIQEKYRTTAESLREILDLSRFMQQAFWLYFKALLEAENFIRNKDGRHLQQAMAFSVKADEILGETQQTVKCLKKLVTAYKESERL